MCKSKKCGSNKRIQKTVNGKRDIPVDHLYDKIWENKYKKFCL